MGKIWVEVCLISARGLRRTSYLFKHQWYSVGWIDPNDKYCSRIDACGNANPVWKTKFSSFVDDGSEESKFQDLALHVEVYSRDPIFLREKLQGTATVGLKEFFDKYFKSSSEGSRQVEEVGSFQLRKGKSEKPQGFVDVSIRISEESSSHTGIEDGFNLLDPSNGINLGNEYRIWQPHPPQFPPAPPRWPESLPPTNSSYTHPVPLPPGGPISGPSAAAAGPSYQPSWAAPPPHSNVGYNPNFLPRRDQLPPSYINGPSPGADYINMPSSGAAAGRGRGRGGGAGLGVGMGAGALAAGGVIFGGGGGDFMSGFNVPSGFQDANLTIVTDPPF